jgi:hypothetical protein
MDLFCTVKASYGHLETRPETEKWRKLDEKILYNTKDEFHFK